MGRRESLWGFCAAAYQNQPPATRLATTKKTTNLFLLVLPKLTCHFCHFIVVYLFPSSLGLIRMTRQKSPPKKKRRYDRRLSVTWQFRARPRGSHPAGGGRRSMSANKRRSSGDRPCAIA